MKSKENTMNTPHNPIQTPNDNRRSGNSDILFTSFIGDALALGPHWVYDQDEIHSKLGRVTSYRPPLAAYHPTKSAGDFTHYGDQTLVLLQSIAQSGGFDLQQFATAWRAFWEDPANGSYRDKATRQTLEHMQAGTPPEKAGSDSHDIGGAARIGPLFLLDWQTDNALIEAARCETTFTHPVSEVVESAEYFARVVLAIRAGSDIPAALESVRAAKPWPSLPENGLAAAQKSAASEETDSAALKAHGLTCHTNQAFPGICHLLLRHPDDPATALIENATGGGDSAARGMILGLVYGAKFPVATLPQEWRSELNARDTIAALIRQLP